MRSRVFPVFYLIFVLFLSLTMTACTTGVVAPAPPITVTLSPSATQTLEQTQTLAVTASVSNDPQAKGVTWGLTPPTGAGTLSGQTAMSVTYSAPASVTSNAKVTLTATSASDNAASRSLTINLVPPPSVATASLVTGQVGTAYSDTLTASNGIPPYAWSVTSGALPGGLTLSGSTISGTPTTIGIFNFTVQVKDADNLTATANLSISITVNTSACGSGSESMLKGGYAFVLKGFDSSGNPALVGGILSFDGAGSITSGIIEMNLNSGGQSTLSATGSYSVGPDQRGCMTTSVGAATQHYRFSLGNNGSSVSVTAHVIAVDATGPFTAGRMYRQSLGGAFTIASLKGSYAFGGSSVQNSAIAVGGGKFGVVGFVTLDDQGRITGGAGDFNDNGTLDGNAANTTWPASPIPIGGSISWGSSMGWVDLGMNVGGQVLDTVLYFVTPNWALFMSADPQTTSHICAGEFLKQSGTPFAANPLSGAYIGYDSGLGSGAVGTTSTDIVLLGSLTSGSSTLAGTQLRNDAGVFSSEAISGTYSVSSTGRLLVSGGAGHEPVLYLANPNQAFSLNGNVGVDSGFFESQSAGPFSNDAMSGTYAYGAIGPEAAGISVDSGVAVFANPNIMATEDNNLKGTLTVGSSQSFTYSIDATGLGQIPASCTLGTNCQTLFYMIWPTKAVFIDATSTNPKIQVADK